MVDQRAPASLHSRLRRTPETPSLSSTATNGRAATLRFAKTASLVTPALADAAVSVEAVEVSKEALALVVASAVAEASAEEVSEDVEGSVEAMAVLQEVVSIPTVPPTPRTPSPISLRQVAILAT